MSRTGNTWLQRMLAIHLDAEHGTPYWLEREKALGFSIRETVQSLDDLSVLGPFDIQALRERPIEDFLPRGLTGTRRWILGETGGATGQPKAVVYAEDELEQAFVLPFLNCVWGKVDFSLGHWLWMGPGGPHVIGKAATRIALATTGNDGFSLDFDPRWFRSLMQGSVARQRYLGHVLNQSMTVIGQQNIRYLFTTPAVLGALVGRMSQAQKESILFVYLGGMPVEPELLVEIGEALPNAMFLSGYGNSMFGVCHEAAPHRPDGNPPVYYPPAQRLHVRIVSLDENLTDAERLRRDVESGERGQVVMSRLDASCFLPNVMERDSAVRAGRGIQAPRPIQMKSFTVDSGIY